MSKARILSRLVFAMLIGVGISVGLAGSASAHDVLISSSPADNATLTVAPTSISFTFDQPIQNFDPVVSLIGPDGRQYATGTPVISGNVITGTVGTGPAGAYTGAYRIVSADGHPVTGEIHFRLAGDTGAKASGAVVSSAPPAGALPSGTESARSPESGVAVASTSAGAAAAAPAVSSGGLSGWLWIALIVAAVIIATAAVLLLRRPSTGRSGDNDY